MGNSIELVLPLYHFKAIPPSLFPRCQLFCFIFRWCHPPFRDHSFFVFIFFFCQTKFSLSFYRDLRYFMFNPLGFFFFYYDKKTKHNISISIRNNNNNEHCSTVVEFIFCVLYFELKGRWLLDAWCG